MPVTHEPWLVALSLIVAIQGAYVGLRLAVRVGQSTGLRRKLLLAGASLSLAVAIWSMHFVGMLAARLPFPVDYLVFPTLLSFLVCVLVVGAAVFAVSAGPPKGVRLAAAATAMGGGIALMHYIGMTALHASAHSEHAIPFVVASVVIAIAASGLALWLAGGHSGPPPLLLSAAALGAAISGMHYTAMAGLTLHPLEHAEASAPALSSDLLAIVVAIVAFAVSAIFLLTLVPDQAHIENSRSAGSAGLVPLEAAVLGQGLTVRSAGPADRRAVLRNIFRWSATVPRIMSPWTPLSRFMPMPITPISSMAPPRCSARCRSAMSRPNSTPAASCGCNAATSSISSACGGSSGSATAEWSNWTRQIPTRSQSVAAGSAG
jgi:NO-binding membrane sensor protein with MHYT domain